LLDAASLLFLLGEVVGFVSPFYSAVERFYFLHVFIVALPAFLFEVAVSFAAGLLSWDCHRNLKNERLRLASYRGVIAAALLIVTGMWLIGILVLAAAMISSMYQTRLGIAG